MKRSIISNCVLAMFFMIASDICAQTTWTGDTDSDWNTASNWDAGVPTESIDAIITDVANAPVVLTAAVAKSVTIEIGGSLTVGLGNSLTIDGSDTQAILNNGTVYNSGTITIGATTGTGQFGINNNGDFFNQIDGVIHIDGSTERGLENVGLSFFNSGTILIGANSSVGEYGIESYCTFTNSGAIEIGSSYLSGIGNFSGSFSNTGSITIGESIYVGDYGVFNDASFVNNTGGTISVANVSVCGIYANSNTFANAGNLTIAAAALVNASDGTFSNETGGVLNGTGTVQADAFVNNGGYLSPGYSPGIMTFDGNEDFSNTTFSIEIVGGGGVAGADFDEIVVNGMAEFGSGPNLNLEFSFATVDGATFDIITYTTFDGSIPPGNISIINTGAGNVTAVDLSYVSPGIVRITVTTVPTTTTWTGATDSDWGTASNWTNGVPNEMLTAIIQNVAIDPIITNIAYAKSLKIQSGAMLSNASLLYINGSDDQGILNQGTVENNGQIFIGNVTGNREYGIENEGIFNNNTGSVLSIDQVTIYGIYNGTGSAFANLGGINMGLLGEVGSVGIYNEATFTNSGSLSINQTTNSGIHNVAGTFSNEGSITIGTIISPGLYGITNEAIFENSSSGVVKIDRKSEGVRNLNGTFSNGAILEIGLVASAGGIYNLAAFNNEAGGAIKIEKSSTIAIYNLDGTFMNDGSIILRTNNITFSTGVYNNAVFISNTGANISIDNSSNYGLYNNTLATFSNGGNLKIGATENVGSYGMYNRGIFSNIFGGNIEIDRSNGFGIYNITGTFTNEASIIIGEVASVGMMCIYNNAVFNNTTGGILNLDRATDYGIYNHVNGTFTNQAEITIGASIDVGEYGILNYSAFNNFSGGTINIDRTTFAGIWNFKGVFTNEATINLGASVSTGAYGIKNDSVFVNNSGGVININRSTYAGIWNYYLLSITQVYAVFENAGSIIIGADASIGNFGINNLGIIDNLATGSIKIDRSSDTGFNNGNSLTNAGTITIGSIASVGMNGMVSTNMENHSGGVINIDNSTIAGLINSSINFPLLNDGIINIGAVFGTGPTGILNAETIINNATGIINIDRSTQYAIYNKFENCYFINAGTITIGSLSSVSVGIWNEHVFNNLAGGNIQIIDASSGGIGSYDYTFPFTFGAFSNAGEIDIVGTTQFGILADRMINLTNGIISINLIGNTGFEGKLYNHAGAILNINGGTESGVITDSLSNSGVINIGTTASTGFYGIRCSGNFTNDTDGIINIDKSTYIGFYNEYGYVNNNGIITIGGNDEVGEYGIYNEYEFNNNTEGEITIDNSNSAGIYNLEYFYVPLFGPVELDSLYFTNSGSISIGANTSVGMYGIENQGLMLNKLDGEIFINNATSCGVYNHNYIAINNFGLPQTYTYAVLTNEANLSIGNMTSVGVDGIKNQFQFFNELGGNIAIDRASTTGIQNGNYFNNSASITIGANVSVPTLISSNYNFENITDGLIAGTGTITAPYFFNIGGTLSPGYSPGKITFTADEDFSDGLLSIEITSGGGIGGIDFDQIIVNGIATLGTNTVLALDFAYTVPSGTSFDILTATSVTGTIPLANILFTNSGLGNVTSVSVTYPGGNIVRVTVASPLPIEMSSFWAEKLEVGNQLYWQTANEPNTALFEIERSASAFSNFEKIGEILAKGQSVELKKYDFLDANPLPESFYRLKMLDTDGQFTISNVVLVKRNSPVSLQIIPNPIIADELNFHFETGEGFLTANVFDAIGRIVFQQKIESTGGPQNLKLNLGSLPPAVYQFKLTGENLHETATFVKK